MVKWSNVALYVGLTLALGLGTSALVETQRIDPVFYVLAPFSPAIAALVMRKAVSREGFADAHLRLRGVPMRYWLLACALPIAWNAVPVAVDLAGGACTLDARAALRGLPRWLYATLPGAIVFLSGEELGWRSYLMEKLRPTGLARAAMICAVPWFAWHPQVWVGRSASLKSGLVFFAGVACLSYVFGWLYYASRSVWPCLVLHALNNVAYPPLIRGAWSCGPHSTDLADAAQLLALAAAAAGVALVQAGRLGRRGGARATVGGAVPDPSTPESG